MHQTKQNLSQHDYYFLFTTYLSIYAEQRETINTEHKNLITYVIFIYKIQVWKIFDSLLAFIVLSKTYCFTLGCV